MKRTVVVFSLLLMVLCVISGAAYACSTCTIGQLGKGTASAMSESGDKKWYFEYLFEQQNWDKMDARDAHELHEDGHDFHDKTTEDIHHFKMGRYLAEDLNVFIDLPYVIRQSLEVDSHSILGSKQESQGLGDLHLFGNYRFWQDDARALSAVAGIKFPSGATEEKNSVGTLFEPELQPGSGSYDYILGGIHKVQRGRSSVIANTSYVWTTRGAQEFEFGDVTTVSLAADYLLNPQARYLKTRVGIDAVFQNEEEQRKDGVKVNDSGGQTLLLGPIVKAQGLPVPLRGTYSAGRQGNPYLGLTGSLLFPVYQHLGGVHQELDLTWTLAGELKF